MKSTKVKTLCAYCHILRILCQCACAEIGHVASRVACARGRRAGISQKLYACALFIIDGLGHATWSSTMPVSRSRTAFFKRNRHISFRALDALEPLVSLMSWFGACSARISGDRHTHTHRQTDHGCFHALKIATETNVT